MTLVVSKLKVVQLKAELAARNLPTSGLKTVLSERLQRALDQEASASNGQALHPEAPHPAPAPPEKRARSPSPGAQERPHKIANRSPVSSPTTQPVPKVLDPILPPNPVTTESLLNGHHPSINAAHPSTTSQTQSLSTPQTNLVQAQNDTTSSMLASQAHSTAQILDHPPAESSNVAFSATNNQSKLESDSSQTHPGAGIGSSKSQLGHDSEPLQTQPPDSGLLDADGALSTKVYSSQSKLEHETSQNQLQSSEAQKIAPGELAPSTEVPKITRDLTQSSEAPKPSDVTISTSVMEFRSVQAQSSEKSQVVMNASPKTDVVSAEVKIEAESYQSQPQSFEHFKTTVIQTAIDDDSSQKPQPGLLNISSSDTATTTITSSKDNVESMSIFQSHQALSVAPIASNGSGEGGSSSETVQPLDAQDASETRPPTNADPKPKDDASLRYAHNPIQQSDSSVNSNTLPPASSEPALVPQTSASLSPHNPPDHLLHSTKSVTKTVESSVSQSNDKLHPSIENGTSSHIQDIPSNQPISTTIGSRDSLLEPPSRQLESPSNTGTSDAATNNQASISHEKIERLLDSDEPPPTRSLYIRNLVRPLTINQLKKKLSEFGELDYFWIDSIRSHAYVTFQNDSAAQAAYCSMHQTTRWPPETGKILALIFIPEKEVIRLVTEEEETLRSYGGRLGLHFMREGDQWRCELKQMTNGNLQQPRGLASSIPSTQVNTLVRSQTLDDIRPKEQPRSKTDVNLNEIRKNSSQEPVLQFDLPENYPKGGPERWFKKTKTKPHLFYSPSVP